MPSNANPFAIDDNDPSSQPVPPQPAALPVDPSSNGAPQIDPAASGGYVDSLRAFLHAQIDKVANTPGVFDENGNMSPSAQSAIDAQKAVASYVPGPASDVFASGIDTATHKKSLTDTLHAAVDTALDPATRARIANNITNNVGPGVRQGMSGFNQGIGNVVFAPSDALGSASDYLANKITGAFGGTPSPAVPSAHDYYDRIFVAPGGAPATPLEKQIRGTAQSFGNDLPALLLGGGVGAAGIRSGVTMAEQAAPGLLDTIRAPAETIVGKLKDMIPSVINGLRPTNIANAVRASNLQGAADTTLQRVAAHPYVASYGDLSRDWRAEKQREAAQSAAQPLN
jgi:hypothetical protein